MFIFFLTALALGLAHDNVDVLQVSHSGETDDDDDMVLEPMPVCGDVDVTIVSAAINALLNAGHEIHGYSEGEGCEHARGMTFTAVGTTTARSLCSLSSFQKRCCVACSATSQAEAVHAPPDEVDCSLYGWERAKKQRKVIDAFSYNGESDIVEARSRELAGYIDGTAVSRTELNFHGEKRTMPPLPDIQNMMDTVVSAADFHVCRKRNSTETPFNYCALSVAKNNVARAVEQFGLDDDDWVIFSDPDEIPDRNFVKVLKACEVLVPEEDRYTRPGLRLAVHAHYSYTTKCMAEPGTSLWQTEVCRTNSGKCRGPYVLKAGIMRAKGLRFFQTGKRPWCVEEGMYASCGRNFTGGSNDRHIHTGIINASWHLSNFGGFENFQRKLSDNSDSWHSSNSVDLLKKVQACSEDNDEGTRNEMRFLKLDQPMTHYPWVPHSVEEDPERFRSFFEWNTFSDEDPLVMNSS